jgi:pimeloyl-[acyl-carrier protein] methyl ester esterase
MTENNTWILLRGLGREKAHWGQMIEQFQTTFAGDQVLFIDLPGTGEFRDLSGPMSIEEIFTFVRAKAIERARSQDRFRIVAMSLGAMVAMEWMRQKPSDLSGAVLVNTSLKSLSPMYHRMRWQVWREFARLATLQNMREREKGLVELLINSEEGQAKALTLWTKLAVEHPVRFRVSLNQLWAASRYEGLREKTDVPVLLLSSLGDRLVDPSCSTALHEKWSWPIERHPWAGHDLPWDDPEWFLQKIKAWSRNTLL